MTDDELLGKLCGEVKGQYSVVIDSLAHGCLNLLSRVQALTLERDELVKANAILNVGMGEVCEGRDLLKHENRELKGQLQWSLSERSRLDQEARFAELDRDELRERNLRLVVALEVAEREREQLSNALSVMMAKFDAKAAELERLQLENGKLGTDYWTLKHDLDAARCNWSADVQRLEAEVERLVASREDVVKSLAAERAQVEALREALQPFAYEHDPFPTRSDDEVAFGGPMVRVGDYRRVAAILVQTAPLAQEGK